MTLLATLSVEADLHNLAVIRGVVAEAAAKIGVDTHVIDDLMLAVDEAATNIMLHGYRGRGGPVEIEVAHVEDAILIILRDRAPVFDPNTAPPPDTNLPLEDRVLGGMGIHLMRQIMTDIYHRERPDGGNELTLVRRLT